MGARYENGSVILDVKGRKYTLKKTGLEIGIGIEAANWLDEGYQDRNVKLTPQEIYASFMGTSDPELVKIFVRALNRTAKTDFEGRSRLECLDDLAREWGETEGCTTILAMIGRVKSLIESRERGKGIKPGHNFDQRKGRRLVNDKLTEEDPTLSFD